MKSLFVQAMCGKINLR